MMEKTNNTTLMNDMAIVQLLGNFINNKRLAQNKTQSQIAEEAGVNRSTLSQIENGEPITLISFIQIMRALDSLSVFTHFETTPQISPIALAKLEQKQRKRARNKDDNSKDESEW